MTDFKKGDYVVLLNYPNNIGWKSMPLNYVYKLFKDSNKFDFTFEKDNDGVVNGWNLSLTHPEIDNYKYTEFRLANYLEILEYDRFNKPCEAIKLPKPKKDNLKYLIKLLKELDIR